MRGPRLQASPPPPPPAPLLLRHCRPGARTSNGKSKEFSDNVGMLYLKSQDCGKSRASSPGITCVATNNPPGRSAIPPCNYRPPPPPFYGPKSDLSLRERSEAFPSFLPNSAVSLSTLGPRVSRYLSFLRARICVLVFPVLAFVCLRRP